ncbi:MAG: chemotaxis protein CheW [Actinobacteria bacterium]|nr:chemotaxis protein CheW [Actinomycetota bacterium]
MANEETIFLTKEQEREILHRRAMELSRAEVEEAREKISIANFLIDGEHYGLDLKKIREILEIKKITKVPGAADYVLGVINLRGNVLAIIDLGRYFGLGKSSIITDDSRIIVVESNKIEAGLLVDSVNDIIQIEPEEIQPPLITLNRIKSEYIYGEVSFNDKLIAMLNLENILKEQ